ncbi:response regulator [Undibacterium terreum]|uniref:Response regulatory domain-containing protein n=1 Tax=Undibacterium terreum TaxID=1224302 RepID=A0A916XAZ4_9BURK|nr:response regulator [Undibacterium terreum]GGC60054.1 hypothetical protein GCM10011396_03700 [Undibacterium terreum]
MANPAANRRMLLVEPETLLRQTVALTARAIGVGNIHEAGNMVLAEQMLKEQAFHGAVISIDTEKTDAANLGLLDQVRNGATASNKAIPIAAMVERCDSNLLQALSQREVTRIILKPFRARLLLDVFTEFAIVSK